MCGLTKLTVQLWVYHGCEPVRQHPKVEVPYFGGPHNEDCSILGSILGSTLLMELPFLSIVKIGILELDIRYLHSWVSRANLMVSSLRVSRWAWRLINSEFFLSISWDLHAFKPQCCFYQPQACSGSGMLKVIPRWAVHPV